jgi:hypothetical protein
MRIGPGLQTSPSPPTSGSRVGNSGVAPRGGATNDTPHDLLAGWRDFLAGLGARSGRGNGGGLAAARRALRRAAQCWGPPSGTPSGDAANMLP